MEIYHKDIILRDYRETDIEDYIGWTTMEIQWVLWDALWETEEDLASFDSEEFCKKKLKYLKKTPQRLRWFLELDTKESIPWKRSIPRKAYTSGASMPI